MYRTHIIGLGSRHSLICKIGCRITLYSSNIGFHANGLLPKNDMKAFKACQLKDHPIQFVVATSRSFVLHRRNRTIIKLRQKFRQTASLVLNPRSKTLLYFLQK